MGTILSDAKEFYPDFFNRGHKDVQSACELLKYKNELEKRLEYIYRVYKFLLNEEKMNKVTVEWIKNNKSIEETARLLGIGFNNAKSQVTYCNKIVKEYLSLDNTNMLRFVIMSENISKGHWQMLNDSLDKLIYDKSKKHMSNMLLVNLSNKEYCKQVSDDDFNVLLSLLEPYFTSVRSIKQQRINEMAEAVGYFNYIMTPGVRLSEKDIQRREKIMKFIDKNTQREIKQQDVKTVKIEDKQEKPQKEDTIIKTTDKKRVFVERFGKYMDELTPEENDEWTNQKITYFQFNT